MRRATATARFASPLGALVLTAEGDWLTGLQIPRTADAGATGGDIDHPVLRDTVAQLHAWFSGQSRAFTLPLKPPESDDAVRLRQAICDISYGTTMTYGDVANRANSIARAIGGACKTNPFPIIVPCHRVTSAAGPEFYSAGAGPRTKTWLLDFEYSNLPDDQRTRLL